MNKANQSNKDLRCVIIAVVFSMVGALIGNFVIKFFGG